IRDHIQRVLGVTVTEVMGIGDIAPSLFGECPHQQGMHFCGAGHVWVELVDPETGEPMEIETGAVGEMVYTTLTREAMPVVRFRGGDIENAIHSKLMFRSKVELVLESDFGEPGYKTRLTVQR